MSHVFQSQEYILARIVEQSSVSMIVFNQDFMIRYANEYAKQLYGYTAEEFENLSLLDLSAELNPATFFDQALDVLDNEAVWRGEDHRKKKDGQIFVSSSSITPVWDVDGALLCYYDASRDNSRRVEARHTLELSAKTDALTGISNRRALFLMLEQQWDFAIAHAIPISIIFCDIDFFKQYNDTYGHVAGDKVLKAVAQQLKKTVRASDFVARYGGEEFVIILVGAMIANAEIIVKKLIKGIAKLAIPHKTSTVSEYLTISIGVSETYPTQKMKMISCIEKADKALYHAKESGRNRYELIV